MISGILFVLYEEPGSKNNNSNIDNTNKVANLNQVIECVSDVDCKIGGCSGQLCLSKNKASNIYTTCEWRDEYACNQEDNCLCINNECKWERNKEYVECIQDL
ncbi:MAG: eight-cysteine-cluster domain-containing protein [Candidatus Kerfeldbacteria bacterium]|jgi:eight-cysteine-cluster-containing protein